MSSKQLKIAEAIKAGKTQKEITEELRASASTVSKVQKMMDGGGINFTEEGKAYVTARKEIDEIVEKVHSELEKEAGERAVRDTKEDFLIGSEIRNRYTLKAVEAGQTLRDFVMDGLLFYVDNKGRIDELEREMKELRFLKNVYAESMRTDLAHVAKMDYFYKFVRYCLHLRSQGIRVPNEVVDSFWSDLNNIGERHRNVIRREA